MKKYITGAILSILFWTGFIGVMNNVNAYEYPNGLFVERANQLASDGIVEKRNFAYTNFLDKKINRKDFLNLISKAVGYTGAGDCTEQVFKDVNRRVMTEEECSRIEDFARLGFITTGRYRYSSDSLPSYWTFDPISRAEYVTIFAKGFMIETEPQDEFNYVFRDQEAEYGGLNKAITRLKLLGLVNGYGDGTFRPSNHISNGEAYAVVGRMVQEGMKLQ